MVREFHARGAEIFSTLVAPASELTHMDGSYVSEWIPKVVFHPFHLVTMFMSDLIAALTLDNIQVFLELLQALLLVFFPLLFRHI